MSRIGHGPLADFAATSPDHVHDSGPCQVRFAGCKGSCQQGRRVCDMPLGACFVIEPAPAEAATEVGASPSPRVPRKLPDGSGIVISTLVGLVFFGVIVAALVAAFKG